MVARRSARTGHRGSTAVVENAKFCGKMVHAAATREEQV
jgi:hypothetical protein